MLHRIVVFFALVATLSATSLTGTFKLPDGTGATGYLYLSLSQQASLVSTGGCGGPIQVVPTYEYRIKVSSGAMDGSPTVYGNDCLLPNGTYYFVRFVDSNGNQLFNDRWVITGSTVNVGTIVSAIISGTTQTLGGAGVVFTKPDLTQTVIQPAGTQLSVNYFAASSAFAAPGSFSCTTAAGCIFNTAPKMNYGLTTVVGSNSVLYIGSGGAFYANTYSGSDASCTGVTNGWMGIRTDTYQLQSCIGGALYTASLSSAVTTGVVIRILSSLSLGRRPITTDVANHEIILYWDGDNYNGGGMQLMTRDGTNMFYWKANGTY